VRVSSDSGKVGNYGFAADFQPRAVASDLSARGTLSAGAPPAAATLTVQMSQQIHFVLAADAAPGAAVQLTIRNAAGQVVFQLQTQAGDAQSADVYLNDGTYSVQVSVVATSGCTPPPVNFTLDLFDITDPVGARPYNPTNSPSSNSPDSPGSPSGSSSSRSTTTPNSSATFS
jgi:hypothetical protein